MKQLKISLPDDLRSRLDAATASTGQSLAEEIRRRLEQTFEADAYDQETRKLAAAVMWMADQIQRDTMIPWHLKPKGHEALAEAVQTYLATIKPRYEPGPPGATDLFIDDPQTLGRSVARHYVRFKEELQKSEQELRQLYKGEKP